MDVEAWQGFSRQEIEVFYPKHRFLTFYLLPQQDEAGEVIEKIKFFICLVPRGILSRFTGVSSMFVVLVRMVYILEQRLEVKPPIKPLVLILSPNQVNKILLTDVSQLDMLASPISDSGPFIIIILVLLFRPQGLTDFAGSLGMFKQEPTTEL